jgi:hypothetical protein
MARVRRLLITLPLIAAVVALLAPLAHASSNQITIFEDDAGLQSNPTGTLSTLRDLGVNMIRVDMSWTSIAPDPFSKKPPAGFRGGDPASYPAANWSYYDSVVQAAHQYGITVAFTLDKWVPVWAEGPGIPKGGFQSWKPNARAFGAFVHAVGVRYSGHYTPPGASGPLPAVHAWDIWNESNYGPSLSPQSTDGGKVQIGAALYRALLDAAWGSLVATGHRHDTILFGDTTPHGVANAGNYWDTAPLVFLRALYCVDSSFHELRGSLAAANGCPTGPAASRRFRMQNTILFAATGFAAHLYAQATPPGMPFDDRCVSDQDRANYADLGNVGELISTLDRLQRVYGSRRLLPVFNTEFGYKTDPPEAYSCKENSLTVSPATAAYYMNWAEYLSYRNPQIASYDQYLMQDGPDGGNFATGLLFPDGHPKPGLAAFRTPLYMPQTFSKHPTSLEVWGGVRPARVDGVNSVQLQFQAHGRGAFSTMRNVRISNPHGYFDVHQRFVTSGTVRLSWVDSATDVTYYSRYVRVTVR